MEYLGSPDFNLWNSLTKSVAFRLLRSLFVTSRADKQEGQGNAHGLCFPLNSRPQAKAWNAQNQQGKTLGFFYFWDCCWCFCECKEPLLQYLCVQGHSWILHARIWFSVTFLRTVHSSQHEPGAVTFRENASYLIGPVLLLIFWFLVLSHSITWSI